MVFWQSSFQVLYCAGLCICSSALPQRPNIAEREAQPTVNFSIHLNLLKQYLLIVYVVDFYLIIFVDKIDYKVIVAPSFFHTLLQMASWHKMFTREVRLREALKRIIAVMWSHDVAPAATGYTANDIIIGVESGERGEWCSTRINTTSTRIGEVVQQGSRALTSQWGVC